MPLTELDARELLSKSLLSLCSKHGPSRVGKAIGGVNEKTVRKARDEQATLKLHSSANLLLLDGTAFDPILKHFGRRSAPIDAVCDTDADRTRQNKVLKAALALSEALEDDNQVSPEEVRQNRATIEAARDALDQMLAKLVRAA